MKAILLKKLLQARHFHTSTLGCEAELSLMFREIEMNWKFPISSDYLELLCALDQAENLEQLSRLLFKEKSVISKRLKGLSLTNLDLIKKDNRKWVLTPLGKKIVLKTKGFTLELNSLLPKNSDIRKENYLLDNSVLMLMNPQKAYLTQSFGSSSNTNAVQQIQQVLKLWRKLGREIIFVKHESTNPESTLAPDHELSDFIPELMPQENELILKKKVASAFTDIDIKNDFEQENWSSIVLMGFTAAECIDATAKDAHQNGLETFIIADAIDTPGLVGAKGEIFHSQLVLGVTLANLHKGIAKILDTKTLIEQLS